MKIEEIINNLNNSISILNNAIKQQDSSTLIAAYNSIDDILEKLAISKESIPTSVFTIIHNLRICTFVGVIDELISIRVTLKAISDLLQALAVNTESPKAIGWE